MPSTVFPELRWAQRSSASEPEKNKLWITVVVANLQEYKVETTDTTFKFTGKDADRAYAVEFELYDEIDASLTREVGTQQKILVELRKKNAKEEYWPRLAKDTQRRPYVRTDFDKWVDEDEQDEVPDEDPMAGLGGMGGMPDMGGMGGMPGMPGMGDGQPSMEQLQEILKGMGGDVSGAGLNDNDDDEERDDNDETVSELGKSQD